MYIKIYMFYGCGGKAEKLDAVREHIHTLGTYIHAAREKLWWSFAEYFQCE